MLIIIVIAVLTLLFLMNHGIDQIKQNDESALIETSDRNQSLPHVKSERSSNKTTAKSNNDSKDSFVYVDIKGAVKHPNVYKMSNNDRIKQLLDKAIATERADLTNINLSERLIDQKMIYVPEKGEQTNNPLNKNKTVTNLSENKDADVAKVNINTATESELTTIPGIGKVKAKSIIEYREQNGNFKSIDELKEINGFGAKTIEN